jgi:hypothetical protein
MASVVESQVESDLYDDDELMDTDLELDDTDPEDFDEFDEDDDGVIAARRVADRESRVPLWRLIEMSGENRKLKLDIADFEDYEIYDIYEGDLAENLAH